MGRMRKQTADYFPHFAYKGRTLTVLESKWGCAGYTFWYKLLELLCSSDGHYYDCSKPTNLSYLAITAMSDEETAIEILDCLSEMGKIDSQLWQERKIIWCQTLVDRLSSLYAKRTTTAPVKPTITEDEQVVQPEPEPQKPKPKQESKEAAKKTEAKAKRKSVLTAKQQELFEKFYAAYPKKVDRATAERAWAKIEPPPDEEATEKIIKAIADAKKNDSRFRDRQYTPNPASWLNAKGYLNEYGGDTSGGFTENVGNNEPDSFRPSGGFRG